MSILATAFFNELKKTRTVLFQGSHPSALLDARALAEKCLGQEVIYGEITTDESNLVVREKLAVHQQDSAVHFWFSTNYHPILSSNCEIVIDVDYYDDRYLSQGPRLIELSVSKSRGYKKYSGESLVLNPFE